MDYLGDTNIGLRALLPADPLFAIADNAAAVLKLCGDRVVMTPQNGVEFWNTMTRPLRNNGYAKTPQDADILLKRLHRLFVVLPDAPNVYDEWQRLVLTYNVIGKQVHDARLVAFMLVYSVTHILTFNTQDFTRYAPEGIVAVDPATIK